MKRVSKFSTSALLLFFIFFLNRNEDYDKIRKYFCQFDDLHDDVSYYEFFNQFFKILCFIRKYYLINNSLSRLNNIEIHFYVVLFTRKAYHLLIAVFVIAGSAELPIADVECTRTTVIAVLCATR